MTDERSIDVRLTGVEVPGQGPGLVVTTTAGARYSRPGKLGFEGWIGARVRFFAASGSNNFDAALLLVGVRHVRGDEVLRRFRHVTRTRPGVVPSVGASVLPANVVEQTFWFRRARVARAGTGRYGLKLAAYERDDRGQPQAVEIIEEIWEFTVQTPPIDRNNQS